MPSNRSLYPDNWPDIAHAIKETADWRCSQCGKQCYRPGEPCPDRTRVLTVHHINHIPADCSAENLVALCAPCHLRADAHHHARNARRTRARQSGQLFLPGLKWIGDLQ
jgi:5-methylcytosine-specific restriction endonuclease McrA